MNHIRFIKDGLSIILLRIQFFIKLNSFLNLKTKIANYSFPNIFYILLIYFSLLFKIILLDIRLYLFKLIEKCIYFKLWIIFSLI